MRKTSVLEALGLVRVRTAPAEAPHESLASRIPQPAQATGVDAALSLESVYRAVNILQKPSASHAQTELSTTSSPSLSAPTPSSSPPTHPRNSSSKETTMSRLVDSSACTSVAICPVCSWRSALYSTPEEALTALAHHHSDNHSGESPALRAIRIRRAKRGVDTQRSRERADIKPAREITISQRVLGIG